jgi:PAS domain S-box-containing protein
VLSSILKIVTRQELEVNNRKKIGNPPSTQEILNHITQGVITTDLDGIVTYWNAASEKIFGYSKEEMINKSLGKIYPQVAEKQFQNDLTQLRNGNIVQGEWKTLTKQGRTKWIDVCARPIKGNDGKLKAIVASAHDIQDLKDVEKDLEESKARAQAILETTIDGIVTVDEDGIILSFNRSAERIFGYSEEEILGKNVKELMPDTHRYRHDSFMERYFETGERRVVGFRRELVGRRKDGKLFPMELSVSEVKWHGNRIFTGVFNDISERRRLEKEILRISEEERRNLGHDLHDGLGQMLTGITLISQNLARKLKVKGIAGANEVQEISDLIKEADEYAKSLAHGLINVDFEEDGLDVALKQLGRQTKKFFNVDYKFNCQCESKIKNKTQALHLYRIAQEAISNAVKHGKAKNIEISLSTEEDKIKLSIKDDGVGFAQSNNESKKKGMGIQIMRYRANILSGTLDIVETEDKRTNVICTVPQNQSNDGDS